MWRIMYHIIIQWTSMEINEILWTTMKINCCQLFWYHFGWLPNVFIDFLHRFWCFPMVFNDFYIMIDDLQWFSMTVVSCLIDFNDDQWFLHLFYLCSMIFNDFVFDGSQLILSVLLWKFIKTHAWAESADSKNKPGHRNTNKKAGDKAWVNQKVQVFPNAS